MPMLAVFVIAASLLLLDKMLKLFDFVATEGGPVPGYDEAPVSRHMAGREILIEVDIGLGKGKAIVWTCDLTHRYIDINGSYRS